MTMPDINIGTYFSEADRYRTTEVEYEGRQFYVKEQFWENEGGPDHTGPVWQVSLYLDNPEPKECEEIDDLVEYLAAQMDKIEVLRRLDYELHQTSDNTHIIFQKPADASGMEVNDDSSSDC